MKKIKILTALSSLSVLGVSCLPLVSCGNEETETFNVYFFTDDKSLSWQSQKVIKGKTATYPSIPTSTTGLDFVAWYTEDGSTKGWNDSKRYDFSEPVTGDISLYARFDGKFNGKSWADVAKAITTFEAIASPTLSDAQTLCTSLGVDASSETGTAKECLENKLVGLKGTIIMDSMIHEVRCIGAMHDKLTSDNTKTAALTFETVSLLTNHKRDKLTIQWGTTNYDYTSSELRTSLITRSPWSSVNNMSVLQLLEDRNKSLSANIKSVTKEVAISPNKKEGLENYIVTAYNDKLFPLTWTEMAQGSSTHAKQEGTAYKFWSDNEKTTKPASGRIKWDLTSSVAGYWLSSPWIDSGSSSSILVWDVDFNGNFDDGIITMYNLAVNFAFCI